MVPSVGLMSMTHLLAAPKARVYQLNSNPLVNVSRVSRKPLQTEPHIVENRGITMALLFLRLTS